MKLLQHTFVSALCCFVAVTASACSSGEPALQPAASGPETTSTGGAAAGDPGAPGTGGASSGSGGTPTNTPTTVTRTELVCTTVGGCEDVQYADGWLCEQAATPENCAADWFDGSCEKSCGKCDGDGGPAEEICTEVVIEEPVDPGAGTERPPAEGEPPPVTGGQTGWGSRYWDCCMQHCSWSGNADGNPAAVCNASNQPGTEELKNHCVQGGGGFTCWSMAPWAVSDTLAYGYAAVAPGISCGQCYQLTFTGEGHHTAADPGSVSLAGKSMIVQAANIGYDVEPNQFDLLIPGGGVGIYNACSTQWGTSDLGAQYGGFLTECSNDVGCLRNKCNDVFAGKPDLLAGCLFHADWMGGADNPEFKVAPIACPAALEQTSGMRD